MQDDILKDLEELRDRTDFIIKNKDLTEVKNIEEYLRKLE